MRGWKEKCIVCLLNIVLFFLIGFTKIVSGSAPGMKEIDSLKSHLTYAISDTNKVWMLRDIAYYYQSIDTDSAIHYSDKAFLLAQSLGFSNGKIWSLYQKAMAYEMQYGLDPALNVYQEALKIAASQNDLVSVAKLYNSVGVAYYYAGMFHHAVAYYHQSYLLSDSLSYMQGVNHALNNMGVIYRLQRRYEQALDLYSRSLEVKRQENDSIGMVNTLYNMGLAYSYLGDHERSLFHLQEAESMSYLVSGADQISMANIQIGIGVALYNLNEIDAAKGYILVGMDKIANPGSHEWIAALNYLGAIDVKRDNAEEGLEKIKLAQEAAVRSGRLELQRQTLRELAIAASLVGQHELAHQSWLEHSRLVDSLTMESKLWAQEEMQARFEMAEMLKMIQLQQQMLQKGRRNNKGYLMVGGVLAILLLTSSVFIRQGHKKQIELQQTVALKDVALLEDRQEKLKRFNEMLTDPLSKREMEVFLALDQGLTNKELAERLFVSENTIKTHLKNIFSKAEVKNRTELLSKLK